MIFPLSTPAPSGGTHHSPGHRRPHAHQSDVTELARVVTPAHCGQIVIDPLPGRTVRRRDVGREGP